MDPCNIGPHDTERNIYRYYTMGMKTLLAAILLLSVGTPVLRAQDFGDMPGLKSALNAYKTQSNTDTLSATPATPATAQPKQYYHRMGHGLESAQTDLKALNPAVSKSTSSSSNASNLAATPNIAPYPVHGADISHYNGTIAWDQVPQQGLSFVFMKATESTDYVDPMFATDWSGAASIGLAEGAYHFYDFCQTGAAQAANFVKTVPVTAGALPMVVDIEMSSDCAQADMPSKAAFLKDLSDFTARMQTTYGKTPILYVNLSMYNEYLAGSADGYKIWIADPSDAEPNIGNNWTFWQYSWTGKVTGMPSDVDLDVFNGDASALAALTK